MTPGLEPGSEFIEADTAEKSLDVSEQARLRLRRVPLFDHLVDIGELLGQPRFAKTLNHQLRIF